MADNTATKVHQIIAKKLRLDPEQLPDDEQLSDYPGDHIDWIEVVMELEDEFDIGINDRDAERHIWPGGTIFTTVRLIEQLRGL